MTNKEQTEWEVGDECYAIVSDRSSIDKGIIIGKDKKNFIVKMGEDYFNPKVFSKDGIFKTKEEAKQFLHNYIDQL